MGGGGGGGIGKRQYIYIGAAFGLKVESQVPSERRTCLTFARVSRSSGFAAVAV